jgi:hypothetical protein
VVVKENKMAPGHLLPATTFDMNSMNASMVTPNPRGFKTNGNVNRAIRVNKRFFQLISEDEKAGVSLSSPFLIIGRMRLTNAKKARSSAARKETRPDPGLENVPSVALNEETSISTANRRKMRLLF